MRLLVGALPLAESCPLTAERSSSFPMFPAPSFVTANLVSRPLGYKMTGGWQEGDRASNDWYAPLATFAARFDEMLAEVKSLGFTGIDLWGAHLNWQWATPHHVATAKQLLEKHGL